MEKHQTRWYKSKEEFEKQYNVKNVEFYLPVHERLADKMNKFNSYCRFMKHYRFDIKMRQSSLLPAFLHLSLNMVVS